MKHNFKNYLNQYFIETGTYIGDGVNAAINAGFNKIISIELSDYYYNKSLNRFKNNNNIKLYHGDSIKVLPKILENIDDRCTFWLDGHFSGGNTACGDKPVPLREELNIISKHKIKTHTILIDDIRLLKNKTNEWSDLEYGLYNIIDLIKSINYNYIIDYIDGVEKNDILIAKI